MKNNNPQNPQKSNWDKQEGQTKGQHHGEEGVRNVNEKEARDFGAKHGPEHTKEINKDEKSKPNALRENFSSQQQKDKNMQHGDKSHSNDKTQQHHDQEYKGQPKKVSK